MALPWWAIGCLFALVPVLVIEQMLTGNRTVEIATFLVGWPALLLVVGRMRMRRGKSVWF